jgi:hypothetical protein
MGAEGSDAEAGVVFEEGTNLIFRPWRQRDNDDVPATTARVTHTDIDINRVREDGRTPPCMTIQNDRRSRT